MTVDDQNGAHIIAASADFGELFVDGVGMNPYAVLQQPETIGAQSPEEAFPRGVFKARQIEDNHAPGSVPGPAPVRLHIQSTHGMNTAHFAQFVDSPGRFASV